MSLNSELTATSDVLLNHIQEEFRQYIFNELPVHLIHLESGKLCDRKNVFERILPTLNSTTVRDLPGDLRASLLNSVPSFADTNNIHRFIHDRLPYAILSDEWGNSKPAYGNVPRSGSKWGRLGQYNVAKFCNISRNHGMEYAWVDSCCINRSSEGELNRSIRSMYRWYENSSICIVHLADSTSIEDLSRDGWFRRGWALLQLLAPKRLKFYTPRWNPLTDNQNDKMSSVVLAAIQVATSISPRELQDFDPRAFNTYEVSKRMRWAANRTTTLVEDRAYSLMGVFGVVIDIAYGEGGSRAFSRLFREIVDISNSPEVVNWVGKPATDLSFRSFGYPSSPDAFIGSNDVPGLVREEPISLASNGLSIKLLVLPAKLTAWETASTAFMTCFETEVRVEYLPDFKPNDPSDGSVLEYALGGWNFSTMDGRCQRSTDLVEAILLYQVVQRYSQTGVWRRLPTRSFIRFDLLTSNLPHGKRWEDYVKTVIL